MSEPTSPPPDAFFARILKHSSQSIASGFASALGSFIAAAIVGRTLGVQGTATVAMALWIVFFTVTMSDIGITGTLARFVAGESDPDRRKQIFSHAIRIFAAAIAFGLLLTALFLYLYRGDILQKYAATETGAWVFAAIVMACFAVNMLFAFSYQLLLGLRLFGNIARLTVVSSFIQIVLVYFGSVYWGANGALLGYMAFSLPMLSALMYLKLTRNRLEARQRKQMAVYAGTFYGTALFSPLLWVRADLIFVDQFAERGAVGLFVAGATVAGLLLQVSSMVCNALAPNLMQAASEGDEQFRRSTRTALRFSLFLLLPSCFIGAALAPQLIQLVFGSAFAEAGLAGTILCIAVVPSAITLVGSSVINATDGNRVLVHSGMIGAVLTIVFGVFLVWQAGILGAACARLLAQTVVAIFNLRALNRLVPGSVEPGWFGPILFSALVAGLAAIGVSRLGIGVLPALLTILVGGGLYAGLLMLLLRPGASELAAATEALAPLPGFIAKPASWLIAWFASKNGKLARKV